MVDVISNSVSSRAFEILTPLEANDDVSEEEMGQLVSKWHTNCSISKAHKGVSNQGEKLEMAIEVFIITLCFYCPGRYSEILPSDLEGAEIIVKKLVCYALERLPSPAIVHDVKIDFIPSEYIYTTCLSIQYYGNVEDPKNNPIDRKLQLECLLSQVLLQLFWEVHF